MTKSIEATEATEETKAYVREAGDKAQDEMMIQSTEASETTVAAEITEFAKEK